MSKDFGKIYLLPNTNVLDEVIIKASAPSIRVKKDTLEINASSFKVRPDSNVEILLKQLAGFDVDNEVSLNESNAKSYRESIAINFANSIILIKHSKKKLVI